MGSYDFLVLSRERGSGSLNPKERPAMGPGFLHTHYFNRFGCMATGNMIRELKLQLITEFLEDQKRHLQGTGASTSLKSIVNLFSLHRCEETSVPFVRADVYFYWYPI